MKMLILFAALAASASAAAAQQAEPEKQWLKAFKAAQAVETDCFRSKKPEDCVPALAAYDKVSAASDADATIQHEMVRYKLNVQRVYAGLYVEAGDLKRGIEEYNKGWQTILAHYDGGKHSHAVPDNFPLMFELAEALDKSGDYASAGQLFGTIREVSQGIKPNLKTLIDKNEQQQRRVANNAVIYGEKVELWIGNKLLDNAAEAGAAGKADEAKQLAQGAADAFQSASGWLEEALKYEIAAFAETPKHERFLTTSLDWARALLAAGKFKEATDKFGEAYTMAHDLITPEKLQMIRDQAVRFNMPEVGEMNVGNLYSWEIDALTGAGGSYTGIGEASKGLDTMMAAERLMKERYTVLMKSPNGAFAIGRYYYVDAKYHMGSWAKAKEIWDKIVASGRKPGVREQAIIVEVNAEAAKESKGKK